MGEMTEAETFEHTQRVDLRRLKVSNMLYAANNMLREVEMLSALPEGISWVSAHNEALAAISMRTMKLLQRASE